MRFTGYSFGSVQAGGVTCDHDLIIDRGKIRERRKAGPGKFRDAYGHTPPSAAEDIVAMPQADHRHRRGRRAAGNAGGPR